jgi:glycosyltransferase involved in cell wall biosynthesis
VIPRVSVVIPVFNGERHIRESLDSLIAQTFADFEIVVVDDGSTDNSVAIVNSYGDPRIRLTRHDRNLGVPATRNEGVAVALGEYVAFLDCDDVALPHRLAKQVACLDADPDLAMVGSWVEIIDNDSRSTGDVWKYAATSEIIKPLLLFQNTFAQSTVMMRKSVLPDPLYGEFPQAEDYDLWIRIASSHKVMNIQEVLAKYRFHAGSLSRDRSDEMEACVKCIHTSQLEELGVTPTLEQLKLHRKVGGMQYGMLARNKDETDSWLQMIYSANRERGVYSPEELGHVVARHWYSACRSWHCWRRFWRSPLSKLMCLSLREKIVFALGCIVQREVT